MDVCCHPLHYGKPSSGHVLKKNDFFSSHRTTTHCQQFLGKWCKLAITYPIYAEIFHDMIFCRFDRSPQLLWVYGFDKMIGFLMSSFAMSSIISLWITNELSMDVAYIPWPLELKDIIQSTIRWLSEGTKILINSDMYYYSIGLSESWC